MKELSEEAEAAPTVNGRKRGATVGSPDGSKPSQKRSRVSRACDQCRASREKCDGTQPICQTCTSQRRECTYNEQPKKRGIQPNYIRTLELSLAWMFRTNPGSAHELARRLAIETDDTHRLVSGKDAPGAEKLHAAWRDSIICRQVDQLLSGGVIEGPGSQLPDHGGAQHHHDHKTQAHGAVFEKSHLAHIDPALEAHGAFGASEPQMLPQSAWTLLEYYFAFTHAWLPITDKQEMLKLMYNFPAGGLPSSENPVYAELWSIMALAAAQLHHTGMNVESERLYRIASSSIPSEYDHFELSHIKALLLLGLLEFTNGKWLAAWLLVGSAVRLVSAMTAANGYLIADMALQGLLERLEKPASGKAMLKLVTLAAFVLESALASHLGAPAHLRPDQMRTIGYLHEEGLEEWAPWHDPLAEPSLSKAPSRSFSTLNRVLRLAMGDGDQNNHFRAHSESAGNGKAPQHSGQASNGSNGNLLYTMVSALVLNASHPSRLQPVHVVDRCERPRYYDNRIMSDENIMQVAMPAMQTNQQPLGYMSIPTHGSTDSTFSTSPIGVGSAVSAHQWPALPQASGPEIGMTDAAAPGSDIFEELAMLERADSNQHPQFMQNLGFAPDIDLAEFFGADYQPSDPLLAYMQPSSTYNTNTSAGALQPESSTEFG